MKKKLINIFIVEVTIVFIFFAIVYLYNFQELDSIKDIFTDIVKEDQIVTKNINRDRNDEAIKEDKLMETIEQGLINAKPLIKINAKLVNGDTDKFFDAVEKVLMKNPEIMYYISGKYTSGFFIPKYSKSKKEIQMHQRMIKDRKNDIISTEIKPNMSQYEKVKVIHNYIINNTKYDIKNPISGKFSDESYTAYGVLVKGVAVCEGYAKAMKYLLDDIDVECMVITGRSEDENHAWNIVNIGGEYYHIDATWDDPVMQDGAEVLRYDYFNLNDEDLGKTHFWNEGDYPKCNSNKYNYYHYNGLVVNNYKEFYNKIEKCLINQDKSIEMKVLNFDEEQYNIPTVINEIIAKIPHLVSAKEYTYSTNIYQGIIRIDFSF